MLKKALFVGMVLSNTNLYAEAVTDGTLGQVTELSGHFEIPAHLGENLGGNLFHSFRVFNVNTGESATFTGPDSITNILARVTGGSRSFIDGTLASKIEGANLYLLNSSGILFGKNARLSISGSFHASTADTLHLKDGGRFTVTQPGNSLLTVAQPSAFGFLDNNPGGGITIEGSYIKVPDGKEISLIGGDLRIEKGRLHARSGRINLASAASAGKVIPQSAGLIMESFKKQGTITISQFPPQPEPNEGSPYPEETDDGNSEVSLFQVEGDQGIPQGPPPGFDGIPQGPPPGFEGNPEGPPPGFEGNPEGPPPGDGIPEGPVPGFEPGEELPYGPPPGFDNGEGIGEVPPPEMELDIPNLDVRGNGGQVFIRAGHFILDNAWIFADTTMGDKKGLIDIAIDGDMRLINSADISAHNSGNGEGTVVSVTATELHVDGINATQLVEKLREISVLNVEDHVENLIPPYAAEQEAAKMRQEMREVFTFLVDTAKEILAEPEANISWEMVTEKIGKEKIVTTYRGFFIDLFNTISIGNASESPSAGGGEIHIRTPVLTIDSGLIEAFTKGPGNAGHIRIDAEQLTLSRLGSINATTGLSQERYILGSGSGQGGNITINASKGISISDFSSITVGADFGTTGKAGNIYLNTPNFSLNRGQINSFSWGLGNAGSIEITADTALLTGQSGIFTEADFATGGNITFDVRECLEVNDNSRISAEAFGQEPQDSGGNITIGKPQFFILGKGSQLLTRGFVGDGGNIEITADHFIHSHPFYEKGSNIPFTEIPVGQSSLEVSRIDASSRLGQSGNVWINASEEDFTKALAGLSRDYIGTKISSNRCAGVTRENLSTFLVINRDIEPQNPWHLRTDTYTP
ncbi:MAG: hypothetical protein DRR08_02210 [Candidatus Parabeggiatoa sp. nov. 2]|nr:MAG: hypothetical protein B6247_01520 [Beggiatoa sp. 4572_84]RKZ63905.1 MAG: hypothetical protein DRR08_02210 [Gammaproteobacteria bacterium]